MIHMIADGDIFPARFVTENSYGHVIQSSVDLVFGVSDFRIRNLNDALAALSGEILTVYTEMDGNVIVEVGETGCVVGDFLITDYRGRACRTVNDNIYAIAMQSGREGDIIAVRLTNPSMRAKLAENKDYVPGFRKVMSK